MGLLPPPSQMEQSGIPLELFAFIVKIGSPYKVGSRGLEGEPAEGRRRGCVFSRFQINIDRREKTQRGIFLKGVSLITL